jgi:hypothetical protein
MEKITSVVDLKNAIKLLEAEQAVKEQLLKDQFYMTYESLKPVNVIKKILRDVSSSPHLIDNIIGTTAGMASGFISKKIFVGSSGNAFRKLIGSLLQVGVTNLISKHPDSIKSLGQFIFSYFLRKRETN